MAFEAKNWVHKHIPNIGFRVMTEVALKLYKMILVFLQ